jgi:hypothetical protein
MKGVSLILLISLWIIAAFNTLNGLLGIVGEFFIGIAFCADECGSATQWILLYAGYAYMLLVWTLGAFAGYVLYERKRYLLSALISLLFVTTFIFIGETIGMMEFSQIFINLAGLQI